MVMEFTAGSNILGGVFVIRARGSLWSRARSGQHLVMRNVLFDKNTCELYVMFLKQDTPDSKSCVGSPFVLLVKPLFAEMYANRWTSIAG